MNSPNKIIATLCYLMREKTVDSNPITEILLIKKKATPKAIELNLANKWNGAGGGFDKQQDKTMLSCVRRELREELGITISLKHTRLAGIVTYNNNHITAVEVHCFFCSVWQGKIADESREHEKTGWFDITDLPVDEMPDTDKQIRLPAELLRTLRLKKVLSTTVTLGMKGEYMCRAEYDYTPS